MPEDVKLRGSGLLKVVSIIMIIFGAIAIVSGLSSVGSGSLMTSMLGLDELGVRYFTILGAISMITGAIELVFGVLGVRYCKTAEKAGFLLTIGIIQIVITAFSSLYNIALAPMADKVNQQITDAMTQMYGGASGSVIPNASMLTNNTLPLILIGFVLPALFIIGAALNRKPPIAAVGYMVPAQPLVQPQADEVNSIADTGSLMIPEEAPAMQENTPDQPDHETAHDNDDQVNP